ncbi:MAG: WxcM-like domain-containing protein [archaeon]
MFKIYKLDSKTDERGSLLEVLRSDKIPNIIAQINILYSKAGSVRGKHYHKLKTEWFFVIRGEALLRLTDLETKESLQFHLSDGEKFLVEVKPFTYHELESIIDSSILVISDRCFTNEEPDTYSY